MFEGLTKRLNVKMGKYELLPTLGYGLANHQLPTANRQLMRE